LIAQDGLRLVCLLRISQVPFSVTSYMLGLPSIDLPAAQIVSIKLLALFQSFGTIQEVPDVKTILVIRLPRDPRTMRLWAHQHFVIDCARS
jgi:hypothetical protein